MGGCLWLALLAALGLVAGDSDGQVNSLAEKVLDLFKTYGS